MWRWAPEPQEQGKVLLTLDLGKFSDAGIGSSRRLVFVAILGKETSLGWSLIFILGIFVLFESAIIAHVGVANCAWTFLPIVLGLF